MNILVHAFWWIYVHSFIGFIPKGGTVADNRIFTNMIIFNRYCQRVSKVVVSICTPTSNVWEFYFLHSYCTRYGNVFEAILPVVSQLVVVHLLSRVWFFVTPWTAALHAPLSSTISQSLLRFMSIELVMVYNRLSMSIWYSIFPLRLMMLNIFSYVYWKSLFS